MSGKITLMMSQRCRQGFLGLGLTSKVLRYELCVMTMGHGV